MDFDNLLENSIEKAKKEKPQVPALRTITSKIINGRNPKINVPDSSQERAGEPKTKK